MCRAIQTIHLDCQHLKGYKIIADGECPYHDLSPSTGESYCNGGTLEVIHINIADSPLLCLTCLRTVENHLDAQFEKSVVTVREHMGIVQRIMDEEERDFAWRDLYAKLVELEKEEKRLMRYRDGAIKRFRESQGVWGDG